MAEEISGVRDDEHNLFNRQQQLQIHKVNEQILTEREAEINHIVKSINDLNELFKDLATMIVDQVS
jgi:syntaxin 16